MIQIGLHGGGKFTISEDGGTCSVHHVTPAVIAFGLSHVTRFGGQAGAYSVGEHSVRMWDWAHAEGQDKAVLRAILLHDAPECLGEGDHQRFVKRAFFGTGPGRYSHMVCSALWEKYIPPDRPLTEWTWDKMHAVLKPYDEFIGSLEARAFGFPHDPIPEWVTSAYAPDGDGCARWLAREAQMRFLRCWEACA